MDATPLEQAADSLARGRPLFLKREDQHELGAFKWRGALPTLERFRAAGTESVVTASTGNHGAATAWAAARTGMRAVVFAPEAASQAKVARLSELGAELHLVGEDLDASKDLAREFASERGLAFFEDGAEPAQFEGYEAIGREIVQQLGERPARVVVPVGNGALLIGVARGLEGDGAVGVVAKEAPVMALSVAAGHPVDCDRCATFADGMAVRVAVPPAVEELVRLRVPFVEVSERALAEAVGAFAAAGIRVEGSAGAALAALAVLEPVEGPTVLVVTGSNIDDELHRRAVEQPESFPG
ncbi:MAG: pyridoxal-phosphate dependent enzyme [Thermoleophilaceae bacterium]